MLPDAVLLMAKVRVYELAKEFGVTSRDVLTALNDLGEFIRSASSTVEAPVERRLRQKLAAGQIRFQPRLPRTKPDPGGDEGKDLVPDWPVPDLMHRLPHRAARSGDHRRTTAAHNPRRRSMSRTVEVDAWSRELFDPDYAAKWRAAGVHDPALALRCINAGLEVSHMTIRLDGIRVAERLRNESLTVVIHRLTEAGEAITGSAID